MKVKFSLESRLQPCSCKFYIFFGFQLSSAAVDGKALGMYVAVFLL